MALRRRFPRPRGSWALLEAETRERRLERDELARPDVAGQRLADARNTGARAQRSARPRPGRDHRAQVTESLRS
jgi:hypothetical protein